MKILWTNSAISDLESIRDYIARDSEYYAARFIGRIVEAVDVLECFPELGSVVPEFKKDKVRERLFQNYRILYQAQTDHILVLAIVHARRNLSLLELDH